MIEFIAGIIVGVVLFGMFLNDESNKREEEHNQELMDEHSAGSKQAVERMSELTSDALTAVESAIGISVNPKEKLHERINKTLRAALEAIRIREMETERLQGSRNFVLGTFRTDRAGPMEEPATSLDGANGDHPPEPPETA